MFTEAIADKEVVCKILNEIAADAKEEVWFDFYRKTTSQKGFAEKQVERQIRRRQRNEHKKLMLKHTRL
jgi:hypothetical protein